VFFAGFFGVVTMSDRALCHDGWSAIARALPLDATFAVHLTRHRARTRNGQ